jgi:hypothetical protein
VHESIDRIVGWGWRVGARGENEDGGQQASVHALFVSAEIGFAKPSTLV